jgi:hypothetical protein
MVHRGRGIEGFVALKQGKQNAQKENRKPDCRCVGMEKRTEGIKCQKQGRGKDGACMDKGKSSIQLNEKISACCTKSH